MQIHNQSVNAHANIANLIDDPLDEIKLSFQGGVQQESQRVELHSEPMAGAFGVWLLEIGAFLLKQQRPVMSYEFIYRTGPKNQFSY